MEAKDLMVGDWVNIKHYKYEYLNCIGQIAGINECEGSIEPRTFNVIYEKDGKKGLNVGVSKRNVFPIPITKEILEKNGFDCSETIGFAKLSFVGGSNEGKFILRVMYDIKSGKQKGWGFFAFNVLTEVNYVHELQHALRLCKIDKKIIL